MLVQQLTKIPELSINSRSLEHSKLSDTTQDFLCVLENINKVIDLEQKEKYGYLFNEVSKLDDENLIKLKYQIELIQNNRRKWHSETVDKNSKSYDGSETQRSSTDDSFMFINPVVGT